MLNLQGFPFKVLYRDGKGHMDADAISRLLRFDSMTDIHVYDQNSVGQVMDKGLDDTLRRRILLDHEFLDPGRDLNPPPLPPAKTRRGYKPVIDPIQGEEVPEGDDLLCHFCLSTDPDPPLATKQPRVFNISEDLPAIAGPFHTSYFYSTNNEGEDRLYQLNTHCHTGEQHAFVLPGQHPLTNVSVMAGGVADPYARQYRPRNRDRDTQETQPVPPSENSDSQPQTSLSPVNETDETVFIPIQPSESSPALADDTEQISPVVSARPPSPNVMGGGGPAPPFIPHPLQLATPPEVPAAPVRHPRPRRRTRQVFLRPTALGNAPTPIHEAPSQNNPPTGQTSSSPTTPIDQTHASKSALDQQRPPSPTRLSNHREHGSDLTEDDDEYRRQQAIGARRVQPLEEYIGRTFEHPRTGNLYEIIHVYWDTHSQRVAAYRHCNSDIADPDDIHPYAMEGPDNVVEHVLRYEAKAGIINAPTAWPRTEKDMLTLQRGDPQLQRTITRLLWYHMLELNSLYGKVTEATEAEPSTATVRSRLELIGDYPNPSDVPMNLQMTPIMVINNRCFYLPLGPDGEYGALRVAAVKPEEADKSLTGKRKHQAQRAVATSRLSPIHMAPEDEDEEENPLPVDAQSMVNDDPHYTARDQQRYLNARRQLDNLPDFEMDTVRESPVCLPAILRRMCLKFLHEGNGHPGSRRTRASVAAKYYWHGMASDIEHHVQACVHCARRKSDNSTKATLPLGRSPIPTRPMQHVHTDLITNLPRSRRGNIHISVTVDALTGYIHATALPDRTATTVAESWINDIMLHFGCPEVVTTDNGVEYTNNLMRAVNALLQIRHHYTVPYNPQANGKVEKRNGTLMATLTQFANANQDDWDVYLPIAIWSYNTTINHATGYTPFRAVFGREARTPSDNWIEDFKTRYCRGLDDIVTRMADNLRNIWWDISKRTFYIRQRDDEEKAFQAQRRPFRPYRRGEQFYFKTIPRRTFRSLEDEQQYKISAKLQYRFSGPHVVTEVISPVVYRVRIDGREKIIHANRMKRDPRQRAPMALSAIVSDDLPSFSGLHYNSMDPLYATSIHLTKHGMQQTEMDYLRAHTFSEDDIPIMTNMPPPPPPRLRRADYSSQSAFQQAIHLGREDYKRACASYQLRLDLMHHSDVSVMPPTLSVHSGIITLSTEPVF